MRNRTKIGVVGNYSDGEIAAKAMPEQVVEKPKEKPRPEKPKYKGIVFWHEAYLLPHKDGGYYYRPLVALSEAEQVAMHKAARKNPPSIFAKRNPKTKRAQRN